MNSRRKFLQGTASTGIAAATLAAFPPSIRRALAIPAHHDTGTIKDVKHVVILMQENRSFDQYFGTLRSVRGFGDRFTIPLPEGRSVWQQDDADGNPVLPYHLDSTLGNAQRVSGTPHSWVDGANAWDGGRTYQWPRFKGANAMSYYKEAELLFQFALANAFTLCDGYHCSMHTGTNSNRMFLWTGTNGPTAAGVASVNNEWDSIDASTLGYEWKTYPERLQEAKVSWIERLDDDWSAMTDNAGKYDLWVLGPNGFHRHFTGDLNTLKARGAPEPEVRVGYDTRRGDIYLKVRNDGERACVFSVRSRAYRDRPWTARVKGGDDAERHWELDDSGQWYDFEVTCDADPTWSRRFAGRVETGRHSVSDPAMGMQGL